MNSRWMMNRMGFVNFWLYDEETFDFADGRLFLRGANASGKSITTQSFIPFILDGDRSPERLDPFGSKDRKMEYYFLGNTDKDDVTGYLFLEFKKGNTEQYRTIGIGQRAQRGKPISFWGFVLLDGKRIGYDLELYQKVGSKKLPLSRQDLKKVLGERNIVVDAPKDYIELVNKHIFGFPRIEQYDQFIRLMIKVRAPKLSRDFKPSKVYEVLNESLQTLSDEDLRAMVDAMEKLDDIQSKLEGLKAAFKDVQIIRNEYDRYNRFMLGKKAQSYLATRKRANELKNALNTREEELHNKKAEKDANERSNSQLELEIESLNREKEILAATDLEKSLEKLEKNKKSKDIIEKEKQEVEKKIEQCRKKIMGYNADLRKQKSEMENVGYEVKLTIQTLEDIQETLKFPGKIAAMKDLLSEDYRSMFSGLKLKLKEYQSNIAAGLSALKELSTIEESWNQLEEELSKLKLNAEVKREQLQLAEGMEQQSRDALMEAYYILADQAVELKLTKEALQSISDIIIRYSGPRDAGGIQKITGSAYESRRRSLLDSELVCRKRAEELATVYEKELEELERLKTMKAPTPERKEKVVRARTVLTERGINYLPFYETVEFAKNLFEEEKALMEEQLLDAGLLDALVVSPKDRLKARTLLADLSDTLLLEGQEYKHGETFGKLVPGDIPRELVPAVEGILRSISSEMNDTAAIVLGNNGYFRHGILEGHSSTPKEIAFIGAQARREKLQRMIDEKTDLCEAIKQSREALEQEFERIQEAMKALEKEYKSLPQSDDLDQALDIVREARYDYDKAKEEQCRKDKELQRVLQHKKECEQKIIERCKPLPFIRTVEAYEEALDSGEDFREQLIRLESEIGRYQAAETNYRHTEERIDREEELINDLDIQAGKYGRELVLFNAEIQSLQAFLNSPENLERASKLDRLKKDLTERRSTLEENNQRIAVLKDNIESIGNNLVLMKEQLVDSIERENKLYLYYEEELKLGFVLTQGIKLASECAIEAAAGIRENDREKSATDLTTSLTRNFQQHSSNLTSYGTLMEDCFEDHPEYLRRRLCIVSTWQGKKLSLEEFYKVLKEAIESNELLIQEKDRKLFEDILADTLSHKLNNRIAESRRWIKDMSSLMQEMDTSMGLTFALDWKPKSADGERELDTPELEKLLSRDKKLLAREDIEKVSAHFRSKIDALKQIAQENGEIINYADMIRDALDYRQWFEFRMHFLRNGDGRKELTNSAFNKFSGGEKAMAMYVPLFAAVSSQFKKSEKADCPRLIALDEAFAGVDDKNISSMFELVHKLDFDYIMNSQALWGCYETVKSLRIAELLRDANSSVVTVIYYYWNGKERILDVQ